MEQPIGVIDSGVGGLTVAHEIMRQLPNERIFYLGDTLRCPYGSRTTFEVKQFTREMVTFLMKKDVKMIVIACNTATAFALDEIQQMVPVPVLGVIRPGARAALKATKNNHIGIIGTEGTIRSNAYPNTLVEIKDIIQVDSLACPLFVPMVEQGILVGEQAENVVRETLTPFLHRNQFDTLVLGCTHYPMLKDTIQKVVGDKIQLISSSEETARETGLVLEMNHNINTSNKEKDHHFYTTGELSTFVMQITTIYKEDFPHLDSVHINKVTI